MAKRNKGINIFRHVPEANLPRTKFNMQHTVKFDGDFGVAYPFAFTDVIAGDTFSMAAHHFARLSPLTAPVLHEFDVHMHWFFVPTRLLWTDFEDWITGGKNGTWREENPDAFPTFKLTDAQVVLKQPDSENQLPDSDGFLGSIFDFMGLNFASDRRDAEPISAFQLSQSDHKFSALPMRAYWLIYNYFFRDQNLTNEVDISFDSGADNFQWLLESDAYDPTAKGLFRVAWDKDYFTSATLTPQRGPQVFIPVGSTAPISGTAEYSSRGSTSIGSVGFVADGDINPQFASLQIEQNTYQGGGNYQGRVTAAADGLPVTMKFPVTGTADLSSANGTPISDIREGFALQRFFERMQITGSRFAEFLRGIFGTNPGDARLQMPEYLGSWTNPFIVNNVSNTAGIEGERPQGSYAGNGLAAKFNQPIVKNFPEPGYLVGLYMALPKPAYQQGISKLLSRTDWLDFFNPYFEHIGEQPILTSELYFDPRVSSLNDKIFGYQSQYASYKFINSHTHGQMKKSLDFWTATREFSSEPTLSKEFIEYDGQESASRCFALLNEPKFYVELSLSMTADRPMTVFSTPKLV